MKTLKFTIEEAYFVDTPVSKVAEILAYFVGCWNGKLLDIFPYEKPENWRAGLEQIILTNQSAFEAQSEIINGMSSGMTYGFSGSHFYLHNFANKRTILITEI